MYRLCLFISWFWKFGNLALEKIWNIFNGVWTNPGITSHTNVVVVYFILSRLLYLAFSANLGLLCMPHLGMGPLV